MSIECQPSINPCVDPVLIIESVDRGSIKGIDLGIDQDSTTDALSTRDQKLLSAMSSTTQFFDFY